MGLVRREKRSVREEDGFTLVEMMVTMMIMIVVLFALYSIFDMSIRVFAFGNDKVEAVENARLGLEKMEREIRAAYPVNRLGGAGRPAQTHLFFSANGALRDPPQAMPAADRITFGNDLDGYQPADDTQDVRCPNSDGKCEYITYKLTDDKGPKPCTLAPCTLRRVNAASSSVAGDPVIEYVNGPGGLAFVYLPQSGDTAVGAEEQIQRVRITLSIAVNGRIQTLTTDVNLRNRAGE